MIIEGDGALTRVLGRIQRVAILGASNNPNRASFFVFSYLRHQGLDVVPVNPAYAEISGIPCAPSLADVQPSPDVVDVFRRPADLAGVVEDVIASGAPVLWLQYGVIHPGAIARADEAGLEVVVDRCLKIEWARLHGGLAMAGMNTRRLTSRR